MTTLGTHPRRGVRATRLASPRYQVLLFLLGLTTLRLIVASQVGLGDAEAYYWTWSEQLAAGYFDHGPLVAWMIRASTSVLGDTPLGVRAGSIILSALTLWLVFALTSRLSGSERTGLIGVLVVAAMPMFFVAGGAANPDVPFALLAMTLAWVLLDAARRRSSGWLFAAGLLAGLATSTKLFGLGLVLSCLVVAWRGAGGWRRVSTVAVPALAALVGALPLIGWNALHDWATLRYHLAGRHTTEVGPSLLNLAKLLGGQLGYVSPFVLVLLAATAWRLWCVRSDDEDARAALVLAAPLLLGGYALILLVPGAEPHWPAAGYLPLVPFAAAALRAHWPCRGVRRATVAAALYSGLLVLAFHLHVLTDLGVSVMPASYVPRYDLSNELRGWDSVARAAARQVRQLRQRHPARQVVVVGCHYTSCAQLRFASRGRFTVACPSPRLDQFDYFPGGDGARLRGVDLLYVLDDRFPFAAQTLYRCARIRDLDAVQVRRARRVVRKFRMQLCEGFDGSKIDRWPPPAKHGT